MGSMRQLLINTLREVCGDDPASGAEVGVFRGDTAVALMIAFPSCSMWFVDPWLEWLEGTSYHDNSPRTGKLSAGEWHDIESTARKNINDQGLANRTSGNTANWTISKELSTIAACKHSDRSLDFVFIDADHTEESVRADIEAWRPKCKKVICGHDYGGSYRGVKKAVDGIFGSENVIAPGKRLWFAKAI